MVLPTRKLLRAGRLAASFSLLFVQGEAIFATSSPEGPPAYCTVFHHMVKSAGSTIKSMLRRACVLEKVAIPAVCVTGTTRIPECLEAVNSSAVITGFAELLRDPLEKVGRDCQYFTVMRHPVDRLVSAFFYCPTDHDIQSRPTKWCGYAESEVPATERLLEFAEKLWRNMAFNQMTHGLFCPASTFCNFEAGSPKELDDIGAVDVLQHVQNTMASYTAVGIMEYWNLSMQLFNERVQSPVRDWNEFKQANPGKSSPLRDEVLQWAHMSTDIHRAIGLDMLLYSYALSIFKHQTADSLGTRWADL